ncbi:YdgA family protein [Pseudomonas sp. NPDC089734]|uniref:YdgA family protein n=1 Tax=Pseudomonas sp. NPDC089734 TaxID=3364469 RepID=UPI0038025E82
MNKSAGIAIGVIAVAGVLATAGAWYTGNQLEGVLNESIRKANQELQESLAGTDNGLTLELVSLDRHFFSSTAHYRVEIQNKEYIRDGQKAEFLFVDNIEHGPIPLSRLKSLKLIPVMALSNFEMEKNASSEKWFAMNGDTSPLKGQASIGYDRSTRGWMKMAPWEMVDVDGQFKFSGVDMTAEVSADARKLNLTGKVDNLQLNVTSKEGPVSIGLKGLTFDTGGTKGQSGLYLGHSNLKIDTLGFQLIGREPLLIKNFVNTNLAQEEGGNLAAQFNYDMGMISYSDKDIGSAHLGFKLSSFDAASTQTLYQFYQEQVVPQQQAAVQEKRSFRLQLSPAEEQRIKGALTTFLAGKPHLELEKLSLKTANGESHMNIAVDLTDPGSLQQPGSDTFIKTIAQLKAQVLLSKPMISDIATLQAGLEGQTDTQAIANQASAASDMLSAMAEMLQLAKVEGNDIVSNLHYANGMVDFNGQKMTLQQFMINIMGKVGALSQK